MPEKLIEIGHITRAHGIKGEVCLSYYAESLELVRGTVWLQLGSAAPFPKKVERVRHQQDILLVTFAGVADRNLAENLRGHTVLVPESALPPATEHEIYLHQLVGLPVYTVQHDTSEQAIGRLEHVYFNSGQEIWGIMTPDGKEILFPAQPQFVAAIDVHAKKILIDPPQGLLELYTQES